MESKVVYLVTRRVVKCECGVVIQPGEKYAIVPREGRGPVECCRKCVTRVLADPGRDEKSEESHPANSTEVLFGTPLCRG